MNVGTTNQRQRRVDPLVFLRKSSLHQLGYELRPYFSKIQHYELQTIDVNNRQGVSCENIFSIAETHFIRANV